MSKLVVFDLDGTLNQTNLYAVEAHRKALIEFGVMDKSDDFIKSHFGSRPEDYILELLPDSDEKVHHEYHRKVAQYEAELIKIHGKEFDGVSEALKKLKENGYEIAICSNSSNRYISLVLQVLKLEKYVDYIQPLLPNMIKDDTLKVLLNQVNPEKAVMVGDRIYDKNAAIANKIPFIGCAYGYNREEVLDSDYTLEDSRDIYQAVDVLIGK